jgi:hypothetical protein
MIIGEDKDFPLQCWNEGSLSAPIFAQGDAMSCVVSAGEGRPPLFNPAVEWWTNPDPVTDLPTQDGFPQGQVLVSVAAIDSATLHGEATYQLEVWRQPVASTRRFCVWRGTLVAGYSAGAARPRLPVYCSFEDMLQFGPWARFLDDKAATEAGFYDQRLEARLWIDDLIVRSFRSSALYPFGTAGVPAPLWSGWAGPWRSPMPSIWIRDQLWGGIAISTSIQQAGFGYSGVPTVTAPPPPAFAGEGLAEAARRRSTAQFVAVMNGTGGIGAILIGMPGFGYIPGSTINLTFSGGGGFGAQATAYMSPGALFMRDAVRRLAAYKALSILGLGQIGQNPQHVGFGQYFQAKCSEEISSFTAELDVNNDGFPDVPIPCSIVNTIYI